METIRLNLAEILAVAWVWQCEIHPKYTEIWSCYGTKCGCVRKPELHVQSYRTFLVSSKINLEAQMIELFRGLSPEEQLKCITMIAANFPDKIIKETKK